MRLGAPFGVIARHARRARRPRRNAIYASAAGRGCPPLLFSFPGRHCVKAVSLAGAVDGSGATPVWTLEVGDEPVGTPSDPS